MHFHCNCSCYNHSLLIHFCLLGCSLFRTRDAAYLLLLAFACFSIYPYFFDSLTCYLICNHFLSICHFYLILLISFCSLSLRMKLIMKKRFISFYLDHLNCFISNLFSLKCQVFL